MLRVLEKDLHDLSQDARRQFPEVKEAAERALQRLRVVQDELPSGASLQQQALVMRMPI